MNIFRLFGKQRTAPAARERLQVLLAHERSSVGSDLVSLLREEILAVIAKHVQLDGDKGAGQDGLQRARLDLGNRRRNPAKRGCAGRLKEAFDKRRQPGGA